MKNPESNPEQSPKIMRLVEDRDVFVRKLQEYKSRLKEFTASEVEGQLDSIYKIAIVQELVDKGEVNTDEVYDLLKQKYGGVDTVLFNNAVGVIDDYIRTGGKTVFRGTGLAGRHDEDDSGNHEVH